MPKPGYDLGGTDKPKKKITETVQVTTEYTEDRINDAIFNLTEQIELLTAERKVWEERKKKVEKEGM